MARSLSADLASHHFCFAGYSGNDIDIRPLLLAAVPRCVFWLDREVNALAAALAAAGKRVSPMVVDLRSFLPSSPRLAEGHVSPESSAMLAAVDPFLRACILSRCIGLATPDNPALHRRAQAVARQLSYGHEHTWRVWYDIAERDIRDAGAWRPVWALVHYLRGWRRASGDARGELLCLRGMWMSCDLLFLGLFAWTYRVGLLFARPTRRAAARTPSDERDYGQALIDLFELRAALRIGQVKRAQAIAQRLSQMRTIGAHLRGHALRFLAQCRAMNENAGESSHVEDLLEAACREFQYIESGRDIRNVHRTGIICAIWRRDIGSARRHYAEASQGCTGPRENARLTALKFAMMAAVRGRWRLARRLARIG